MSYLPAVARPYAKAAFEYAKENNLLAAWTTQLQTAAAVVNYPRVLTLLKDPRVGQKPIADLIFEVCKSMDAPGRALIALLMENKHLNALPEIAVQYEAYRAAYEKRLDVTVTT